MLNIETGNFEQWFQLLKKPLRQRQDFQTEAIMCTSLLLMTEARSSQLLSDYTLRFFFQQSEQGAVIKGIRSGVFLWETNNLPQIKSGKLSKPGL